MWERRGGYFAGELVLVLAQLAVMLLWGKDSTGSQGGRETIRRRGHATARGPCWEQAANATVVERGQSRPGGE